MYSFVYNNYEYIFKYTNYEFNKDDKYDDKLFSGNGKIYQDKHVLYDGINYLHLFTFPPPIIYVIY